MKTYYEIEIAKVGMSSPDTTEILETIAIMRFEDEREARKGFESLRGNLFGKVSAFFYICDGETEEIDEIRGDELPSLGEGE